MACSRLVAIRASIFEPIVRRSTLSISLVAPRTSLIRTVSRPSDASPTPPPPASSSLLKSSLPLAPCNPSTRKLARPASLALSHSEAESRHPEMAPAATEEPRQIFPSTARSHCASTRSLSARVPITWTLQRRHLRQVTFVPPARNVHAECPNPPVSPADVEPWMPLRGLESGPVWHWMRILAPRSQPDAPPHALQAVVRVAHEKSRFRCSEEMLRPSVLHVPPRLVHLPVQALQPATPAAPMSIQAVELFTQPLRHCRVG